MVYSPHTDRYFKGSVLPVFFVSGIILLLLLTGCSTTRTLGEGELLYKGAGIHVQDKGGLKKVRLRKELQQYARPAPNSEVFGILPLGLWFYNMAGDSVPERGFRHWLKYKLGDQPVIFEYYNVDRSENAMQNYLFSKGYFDSRISTKREISGKKIRVSYDIQAKDQYRITSVAFPVDTTADKGDSLVYMIDSLQYNSLIKAGEPYDFETLMQERQRITGFLRDRGYFDLAPDYIYFKLDSNYVEKTVGIYLDLKQDMPEEARQKYFLDTIMVHADYSLEADSLGADTLVGDNFTYIFHEHFIRPKALSDAILLRKGQEYSFSNYSSTLNKLMGLGVYKFANIRYSKAGREEDRNKLNAELFLTRTVPKSIRMEIQAVTKSNNFAGPGINLRYQDRNLFAGAESFNFDINGSFETQIAGKTTGLNAWQLGLTAGLKIPRFIFPFIDMNGILSKKFTPQTTMNIGYNRYNRPSYFSMNSATFSYGYNWRETVSKSHEFQLLNVDYSRLSETSTTFDSLLSINPLIRESFSEQFIFSLSYTYTYNNQLAKKKPVNTFFEFNGEIAGNTIHLFQSIFSPDKSGETNVRFLGIPYSQYARGTVDLRFYVNGNEYNKLVNRWQFGIGIPYGNSNALPYRRQLYVGGPNSLRGFRYRSVGPGSFSPDSANGRFYFDQTGDIKVESNLEYRFTIYRLLKGALFLDAGNIWLLRADPLKPGGEFQWKDVLSDLALNSGFGFRFDASFFVLRFDLGIPLRKPWLPEGEEWSIHTFNLLSPSWRRDNLILNIAIGYPF